MRRKLVRETKGARKYEKKLNLLVDYTVAESIFET